jgi:hypothetical protein
MSDEKNFDVRKPDWFGFEFTSHSIGRSRVLKSSMLSRETCFGLMYKMFAFSLMKSKVVKIPETLFRRKIIL